MTISSDNQTVKFEDIVELVYRLHVSGTYCYYLAPSIVDELARVFGTDFNPPLIPTEQIEITS